MIDKEISAGIFRRIVANFIDGVFIILISATITLPFSSYFVGKDLIANIIFMIFTLLYFSFFESSEKSTFGKRALNIKVINEDGAPPSYLRAFGRRFIIAVVSFNMVFGSLPIFINPSYAKVTQPIFYSLIGIITVGLLLFTFFHPQKRGIHDLLFKTRVVLKEERNVAFSKFKNFTPIASSIAGLVSLIIISGVTYVYMNPSFIMSDSTYNEINFLRKKISHYIDNENVRVTFTNFTSSSSNNNGTYLNVTILVPELKYKDLAYQESLMADVSKAVMELYEVDDFKNVSVTFYRQKYFGIIEFKDYDKKTLDLQEYSKRVPTSV
ncbi:RDD family protein [Halobacteriovorax sp. RT-2-4]|uniref:RDD family protein n=1 Tax=unclassified Halobacteriovorax TaxID=2639665 RepID=UPI003999D5D6